MGFFFKRAEKSSAIAFIRESTIGNMSNSVASRIERAPKTITITHAPTDPRYLMKKFEKNSPRRPPQCTLTASFWGEQARLNKALEAIKRKEVPRSLK